MNSAVKIPVEQFFNLKRKVDPAVLDFNHLAVYTGGDAILEGELLGLFETQVTQLAQGILQSNDQGDWEMAVHTLKGGAGGIGAHEIEKACEEMEKGGFLLRAIHSDRLAVAVERCVEQIGILTKSA